MFKGCLLFFKVSLEYCNRMNLILLSNFCCLKSSTRESMQHLELFFFSAYPGNLLLCPATNHETSQFHGKKPIHSATKQLLANYFTAHIQKAIICKVHCDKQRRQPVASQAACQSSQACLITPRLNGSVSQHICNLFMAHQLGNSDIHGSFPFLPELSPLFGNISSKPANCKHFNTDK